MPITTETPQPPNVSLRSIVTSPPGVPLQAFTDGACKGNPGPGGWAIVYAVNGKRLCDHCGSAGTTTNNLMELTAVREAIKLADPLADLEIVTDSINVIGWLEAGWRRKNPNVGALCKEIEALTGARSGSVTYWHCKGHSGHALNTAADRIASAAAKRRAAGYHSTL